MQSTSDPHVKHGGVGGAATAGGSGGMSLALPISLWVEGRGVACFCVKVNDVLFGVIVWKVKTKTQEKILVTEKVKSGPILLSPNLS